jgi:hypothetical protein
MNKNLILRSGKYKGYTVREAWAKDPSYIRWVSENVPAMLKSHGKEKPRAVQSSKPFEYKEPPNIDASELPGYIKPGNIKDAFF